MLFSVSMKQVHRTPVRTVTWFLLMTLVCGFWCVSIHLRTNSFEHASHQTVLHGSTNITSEIFRAACRALDEAWDGQTPLRQLGVQVTRLSQEPYQQYDLFSGMSPTGYERKLRLDETVDALRDKYGETVIRRAKFTDSPESHMAGGLDKARRTGVTKPIPPEFDAGKIGNEGV